MSQFRHKKTSDDKSEVVHCEVSSPPLSHSVKGGQMVEVAGVEPAMLDGWVLVLEWLYSVAL